MDQIRMSDACEQKIQCAIKQGAQTRENPHHTVWKKVITALTAIVCVGVVGAFSVAAAQQINLWELFFSKAAEVTEPAVQTVSGVQNFAVSGFDGFTLEPMGVMHDAKQLRFVVRVSADENEMLSRIGSIHEVERLVRREDEIMINGTSIWDQTRTDGFLAAYTNCYGQKLEDGAYAIVFELNSRKVWMTLSSRCSCHWHMMRMRKRWTICNIWERSLLRSIANKQRLLRWRAINK